MKINEVILTEEQRRLDEFRLLSPSTIDSMSRLLLGKKHDRKIISAIEEYFARLDDEGKHDPMSGEKQLHSRVADRHGIDLRVFNKYLEYYLEHGKI